MSKTPTREILDAAYRVDEMMRKMSDPKYADLSILPGDPLNEVALAFMSGLKKYPRDDWKRADIDLDFYRGKALRHIFQNSDGKLVDEESGVSPLAHAVADLLIVLWHEKHGAEQATEQADLPLECRCGSRT